MSEAVVTAREGNLHFEARTIPLPTSISPAARQALINAYTMPAVDYPASDADRGQWYRIIGAMNSAFEPSAEHILQSVPARVEVRVMGGVTVYVGIPNDLPTGRESHALMTFHGGAFICFGGKCAMALAAQTAVDSNCTTFAVDYRMPPDHPYPAALEDGFAVYRQLIEEIEPAKIAVSGCSAGGNLAAALTLKLRDEGYPLPAAVVLTSPALDLTESGDSYNTNLYIDGVLKRPMPEVFGLYANGVDLTHPYLSPMFADYRPGFPPTFLQAGTRDLLLSSAVRTHRAMRAAGVDAELHIWEGMPHPGFGNAPEDKEIQQEINRFLEKYWQQDADARGTQRMPFTRSR
jgi:acetyl esterase/lipase